MKSKKLAQIAIAALEDMKGQSIRCINVEKLTAITDYMIIATGTSSTHIRALADTVVVKLKESGQKVAGVEGKMQSEWVLVDAGGIVVHIMMAPVRALYNLEDLWDFKGQSQQEREADMAEMHAVVSEKKVFEKKGPGKKVFGKPASQRKYSKAGTSTRSAKTPAAKNKPETTRKPAAKKTVAGKPGKRKVVQAAE